MLNPVFTDPNNALLKDRLARISASLRNLTLSTAEEYQAEVYSDVNAVLSLGYAMTPLFPIASEGPAVVGDSANNYSLLNNDAQDIVSELLRIEDLASGLFNLAATSQNQLRQQVRESIYASNHQRYLEEFLNSSALASSTAGLDFNAGVATNPLLNEVQLAPVISIGVNSSGSLDPDSTLDALSDSRPDTAMVWDGPQLELVLTFSTPTIMNRLQIDLDDYVGLEMGTFTTSPDGTLVEDVLSDLGVDNILMDSSSCKFSGNVIIDFPPRHTTTARIVILDRVGVRRIALRGLSAYQRRYSSTGQLTTNAIDAPTGSVMFTSQQNISKPLTSITHQMSYDGTQFTAISPGRMITLLSSPFYYRAVLERSSSRFNTTPNLVQKALDPVSSTNYTLTRTTTTPLGNGIIERTLGIDTVTGPIVLRETIMPGTLQVQEGSILLSQAAGNYTFANRTLTFPIPVTGVIVTYQTTSLGSAAIKDREEYYTPLLYEFRFERYLPFPTLSGVSSVRDIHLTWSPSEDPLVTSYNVYRGTVSGGPYSRIATGVVNTFYNDTVGAIGTYYYVTTAVSDAGESDYSNEFSVIVSI